MKFVASTLVAAALVLGAASAQAQSVEPQIPTPANPAPLNPVATNGTPLPYAYVPAEAYVAGRSAVSPLEGFVGFVPNTVNGVFGR